MVHGVEDGVAVANASGSSQEIAPKLNGLDHPSYASNNSRGCYIHYHWSTAMFVLQVICIGTLLKS